MRDLTGTYWRFNNNRCYKVIEKREVFASATSYRIQWTSGSKHSWLGSDIIEDEEITEAEYNLEMIK